MSGQPGAPPAALAGGAARAQPRQPGTLPQPLGPPPPRVEDAVVVSGFTEEQRATLMQQVRLLRLAYAACSEARCCVRGCVSGRQRRLFCSHAGVALMLRVAWRADRGLQKHEKRCCGCCAGGGRVSASAARWRRVRCSPRCRPGGSSAGSGSAAVRRVARCAAARTCCAAGSHRWLRGDSCAAERDSSAGSASALGAAPTARAAVARGSARHGR